MIYLVALGLIFIVAFLYREHMYQQVQKQWMEERRELLNRIKPETAQIVSVDEAAIFEPVRDDADFWASHENLLKEQGTYPYGYEEEARGR